jgi:predicted AAA+ superfamily ATPase
MYKRNSILDIKSALHDSPVVLINGARQVGKSTLAKVLIEELYPLMWDDMPGKIDDMLSNIDTPQYFTLDDATTLAAATSSPLSFLEALPPHVVIDEIQRAPELFLAIKKLVDQDRKPGRFLLTGSANAMTLPKVADSLAGRMEVHTLWPLSQGEIEDRKETFIDHCFGKQKMPRVPAISWKELSERVMLGGYPEILKRQEPRRRNAWYRSYLTSIIERDIRELANIEGYKELPNLLQLLAARVGGLLNFSDISRISKIGNTTLKRYMALLEAVFIFVPLPAWYRNEEKRLIKSPKVYLNDTGLIMHLRGMDQNRLDADHTTAGLIVENFVVMELKKQLAWSETLPNLYHFRTTADKEVDIVLEAPDGRIVGVEVKSSGDVNAHDFAGMKELAEIAGNKFHRGIVLYTGRETVSFGPNLAAIPISALWQLSGNAG